MPDKKMKTIGWPDLSEPDPEDNMNGLENQNSQNNLITIPDIPISVAS